MVQPAASAGPSFHAALSSGAALTLLTHSRRVHLDISTAPTRVVLVPRPDDFQTEGLAGLDRRGQPAAGVLRETLDRGLAEPDTGHLVEQIRAARPSKEFDSRFATEICCSPNNVQNSTVWYQQMYNEAKTHLPAPPR